MADRVYLGGTFDLLHPGHLKLLKRAAKYGEVWVALNKDDFCERYKRRPVMNYQERRQMLAACRFVHRVIPNEGGENSKPSIVQVSPRYIVHGDDWQGHGYLAQLGVTEKWLAARNIEILYLPYTGGVSTSAIIRRCVSRS